MDRPRKFYRATASKSSKRIVTGDSSWDSYTFASDNIDSNLYYGDVLTEWVAKPGAKILYEGTREFRSIAKGLTGTNALVWASTIASRAKASGYDAVWFKRQGDIGTAIINVKAFNVSKPYNREKVMKHNPVTEDVRSEAWGLKPGDKFIVTKGSTKLGVGIRNYGTVKDVWQSKRDLDDKYYRVMVRLSFVWPVKSAKAGELVLYATHPNRLSDSEASLLNSRGDKIHIRKQVKSNPVSMETAKVGDVVEVEVGEPWPDSPRKIRVTGKVVRVKRDGMMTVNVERSRENPMGHPNEDVGYIDIPVRRSKKNPAKKSSSLLTLADRFIAKTPRSNPVDGLDEEARFDQFIFDLKSSGKATSDWGESEWYEAAIRFGFDPDDASMALDQVAAWGIDD